MKNIYDKQTIIYIVLIVLLTMLRSSFTPNKLLTAINSLTIIALILGVIGLFKHMADQGDFRLLKVMPSENKKNRLLPTSITIAILAILLNLLYNM